jgi:Holliday junction resolvase RusA-like endonuclease
VTITLSGEPRSTNHLYKSVCRAGYPSVYLSPEGKALKQQYQWQVKAQWRQKPLDGDVELSIALYFGTKRRADWDNFHKLSMDALSGIVWSDDSQITRALVTKHYDKGRPRIEIAIMDYHL